MEGCLYEWSSQIVSINKKEDLQWLININPAWMPVSDVRKSVNPAAISVSAKWRNAHASASIVQTSAGPVRHSLAEIPGSSQSSAASAPRFATHVPRSARSTRTNIAVGAPRPAANVRKNVGKWPQGLGHGNSRLELGDKVVRTVSGQDSGESCPLREDVQKIRETAS